MTRTRLLMALGTVALIGGLVLLAFAIVQGGDVATWGGAVGGIGGGIAALSVGRDLARQNR